MNKNELIKAEKDAKTGKTLLIIGIIVFIVSIISIGWSFSTFINNTMTFRQYNAFGNMTIFIISDIFAVIGIGLLVVGIVLFVTNNKKITNYTKENIIPKAKETYKKVEPVISDVATAVGNGIEQTAKDIKESFNKRKNKKGE